MTTLTLDTLLNACSPGGPSVLTSVTELAPAAGPHAGVAPARYVQGNNAVYAFETRFIDGEPRHVVVLDSKSSQLNRVEDAIAKAIADGVEILKQTPRIAVSYPDRIWADYELPHRYSDGHIRAGTKEGKPVTAHPAYRAARDANPGNARALLEMSGLSLPLGAWDSTRRSHQGRYRSALVGEIIGVLADQSDAGLEPPRRGGARFDQVAPSVQLTGPEMEALLASQEDELSPGNAENVRKAVTRAKKGKVSASPLGLGSIPPSLETLGLVACSRIVRSHVLSFATLRQLRFDSPGEGDIACRALLAALALNGLVRSNTELYLRANCDLVERDEPTFLLDQRNGNTADLGSATIEEVDAILAAAIEHARSSAGLRWEGQIFEVTGNPSVYGGALEEADGDGDA